MTQYPQHILSLIEYFKKLPGVGQRSAERYAFQILDWPEDQLSKFGELLKKTSTEIQFCPHCHAMSASSKCFYCDDLNRTENQLCVVAYPKDIFSIEDSHSFSGRYHVLGGLLSPSNGFTPEHLNLITLMERIQQNHIEEIILAFDSTVEGDATTLFLKEQFSKTPVKVSRLAFGIPVGSSLEYIDSSTLSRAFDGRQGF